MAERCAWCNQVIRGPKVSPHNVPFHPECFVRRRVILGRAAYELDDSPEGAN